MKNSYIRMQILIVLFVNLISSLSLFKASKPRNTDLIKQVSYITNLPNIPQGFKERVFVESCIADLSQIASLQPDLYKKKIAPNSAWKTIWTSVTADNVFGILTRSSSSSILGGKSWQVFDSKFQKAENIVLWDLPYGYKLRMCGLAGTVPFADKAKGMGYDLEIRGLEFRWNRIDETNILNKKRRLLSEKNDEYVPPEVKGYLGDAAATQSDGVLTIVKLKDDYSLRNGIGTLKVLFNDGALRITRDEEQKLTYVHVRCIV